MHSSKGAESGLEPPTLASQPLLYHCPELRPARQCMVQGSLFKFKGPVGTCPVLFSERVPGGLRDPVSPASRGLEDGDSLPALAGLPVGRGARVRSLAAAQPRPRPALLCGVLGRCGSWWPAMSLRPPGRPPTRGVCTRGVQKTQCPFSCLCYISMWTKIYKPKKMFFLRHLQNMVYFYVEKKSYEGSCYFERKFIRSPCGMKDGGVLPNHSGTT